MWLSIYLYLYIYISLYTYIRPAIHASIQPTNQPSSHPFMDPSIYLSIHLYIYLSTYLSIYLYIYISQYLCFIRCMSFWFYFYCLRFQTDKILFRLLPAITWLIKMQLNDWICNQHEFFSNTTLFKKTTRWKWENTFITNSYCNKQKTSGGWINGVSSAITQSWILYTPNYFRCYFLKRDVLSGSWMEKISDAQ